MNICEAYAAAKTGMIVERRDGDRWCEWNREDIENAKGAIHLLIEAEWRIKRGPHPFSWAVEQMVACKSVRRSVWGGYSVSQIDCANFRFTLDDFQATDWGLAE